MSTDARPSAARSKFQEAKELKEEDKLYRYDGVLYPRLMCPEEHMKALKDFQAREDDVMLVAYPKCGFNWMVGVLRKIIAEAKGVKVDSKMPPLIEFFEPDVMKSDSWETARLGLWPRVHASSTACCAAVNEAPPPRLLGTHVHLDNMPASFRAKKTKMLVIFRNPKDTAVSFYHFSNNNPVLPSGQSWDAFFSDFMRGDVPWGSYFDHALAWEKRMDDPDVMVVTYEDLKEDLSGGVRQISTFFGFSLTEAQVQQIAEASTFSAMKQSSSNSHGNMGNVFFRKGEVGDWKNHFTPKQSQEMDDAFNKHLAGTRLGAKLNYQVHCK